MRIWLTTETAFLIPVYRLIVRTYPYSFLIRSSPPTTELDTTTIIHKYIVGRYQ